MQQWRYHSMLIRDLSIADAKLNAEGEKGWEMVSVCLIDANSARVYFKMPAEHAVVEQAAKLTYEEHMALGQNPF